MILRFGKNIHIYTLKVSGKFYTKVINLDTIDILDKRMLCYEGLLWACWDVYSIPGLPRQPPC